jgi:hypothetical protein
MLTILKTLLEGKKFGQNSVMFKKFKPAFAMVIGELCNRGAIKKYVRVHVYLGENNF